MYRQIHAHMCIRHGVQTSTIYMPCYFASIQNMINDYSINKIYNQKDNWIFHIYMLKLHEGHMNDVQMMNQQDLMKVFPLLLTSI